MEAVREEELRVWPGSWVVAEDPFALESPVFWFVEWLWWKTDQIRRFPLRIRQSRNLSRMVDAILLDAKSKSLSPRLAWRQLLGHCELERLDESQRDTA